MAALTQLVNGDLVISKDLTVEGVLTAEEGDFTNIFVTDETTISEFLTSD
jgi:hypothetical protein